mgnify:CR=1 FL=1|tara:strand:- start:176 stop:469 length:294 start_codon:yes stop_codon:yes gene_type:complete
MDELLASTIKQGYKILKKAAPRKDGFKVTIIDSNLEDEPIEPFVSVWWSVPFFTGRVAKWDPSKPIQEALDAIATGPKDVQARVEAHRNARYAEKED